MRANDKRREGGEGRMRPSKFTEEQIVRALRRVRAGTPAVQVCREMGITETTFYRWRNSHDDVRGSAATEVRNLRDENNKLRQIVADLLLAQQRIADERGKR